ncbi:MAG: glycosyltransferase family 2 protein [Lachnospiraceae bacterium]|nr:glycosyltransferase family 2 protein [Lachnospiraceae bacterium]
MTKTKISIIIPIYNGLPYLYECLDSIVAQRSVNMEVLLINNGSTDDTLKVCRNYAKDHSFIKVYDISICSIGGARNFGLAHSTGEYIMFIDADDFLPDSLVLHDMLRKSMAKSSDICVGNFSRLWGDKLLHATSHRTFSKYPQNGNRFLFTGFFSVDILSYVWAKLFKKSFIMNNGLRFADCRYAEDKLFTLQCSAKNAVYSFINREVYVHRNNPDSVSNSYRIHSHLIWLDIARNIKDTFKDEGFIPPMWERITAYTIFFGCFFDCKMEYLHFGRKTSGVVRLLKQYAIDPLAASCFKLLSHPSGIKGTPSRVYRVFISVFAFCMRFHLYHLVSFGIKLLVELKIDEMLSDTGRKPS